MLCLVFLVSRDGCVAAPRGAMDSSAACGLRGGGGGTLIFSHIHRLELFFGVQNSEFQYFGGFQKNEYFLGYEDFVDIFFWGGVITKLG